MSDSAQSATPVCPNTKGEKRIKLIREIAKGTPYRTIAKHNHVSKNTVLALKHSPHDQGRIESEKRKLALRYDKLADRAVSRALETVAEASFRDAVVASGIAVDKALVLRGETPPSQVINIAMLGIDPETLRIRDQD